MKNRILTFAITGVIAMTSLSVVAQESKKAANARKELANAKKNLNEAKIDSAADFQKFKKESEIRIGENQTKIAELKAKKSSDTKEVKKKYDEKVVALEAKNEALRTKIKNADDTKTSMWASFKRGFNHDMQELEVAIKSI
jgi:hypothetical protein